MTMSYEHWYGPLSRGTAENVKMGSGWSVSSNYIVLGLTLNVTGRLSMFNSDIVRSAFLSFLILNELAQGRSRRMVPSILHSW